jgi:hypothetical protein
MGDILYKNYLVVTTVVLWPGWQHSREVNILGSRSRLGPARNWWTLYILRRFNILLSQSSTEEARVSLSLNKAMSKSEQKMFSTQEQGSQDLTHLPSSRIRLDGRLFAPAPFTANCSTEGTNENFPVWDVFQRIPQISVSSSWIWMKLC